MAFIQNTKPPVQDIRPFKLDQFEGGLDNVSSTFTMNSKFSPNLKNVMMFEQGVMETRPGTFKYITDILGETIQSMFLYETASISKFILSSATKVYSINTSGGTITQITTCSGVIDGEQHDGKFFFVDGAKYKVYDGTDVFEITQPSTYTGIADAGAANTITFPSGASSSNDYYKGWEIYIVSGTGSGQTRTFSGYVGATKVATVSSAWTTQPDNTSVFYTTSTAQGVVTTVGTPTFTKTYSPLHLEFTDIYKGANNITDILGCKKMTTHKSRFFFSNNASYPNSLYYTSISTDADDFGQSNMYYVPSSQYSLVTTNNGDSVKGTVSFNDVLCIFKSNSVFALFGFDESDYDLKEVTVDTGTVNINTVKQVANSLFYLGNNGKIYSLYDVRTDYKKLLSKSVSDTIDLNKPPINVFENQYSTAHAMFVDKYYLLSVGDKVMVYTIGFGWTMWDNLNPTCFLKYNNTLLMTNSSKYIYRIPFNRFFMQETFTAGAGQTDFTVLKGYLNEAVDNPSKDIEQDVFVYVNGVLTTAVKVDNTKTRIAACVGGETVRVDYLSLLSYNDNSVAYESYWESKDYDFNFPGFTKQLRRLYVTAATYKYFTSIVNFDLLIDYYEFSTGIAMKNQISLWGWSQFGDRFIDRNIVNSTPITINKRGKIIRFKFYNDVADQPFRIFNVFGEVIVRHK